MNSLRRKCLRQYRALTVDEKTDLIYLAVKKDDRNEVKRLAGLQAIESDSRRTPCDKCKCLEYILELLTDEQIHIVAGWKTAD